MRVSNWSVRFLITGGHRTEATESPFSKTAVEIDKGAITTAAQLAKELGHLIPDDDAFRSAFATATSSKAIIARYYLRAIEDHRAASPHPEWVTHKNAEKVNLEHVLPVNPSREWGIDADSAELLHRRLGNLALLPSAVNVKLGNKPFAAKKAAFTDCSFYYTSWIAAQAEWTEAQIDQRQKLLADEAVKTWPLKVW